MVIKGYPYIKGYTKGYPNIGLREVQIRQVFSCMYYGIIHWAGILVAVRDSSGENICIM